MNPRIVVIGGLAAGPSAASKAKRVNPDAEVVLFEQGDRVSYGICEVPYYVGGVVSNLEDLIPLDPTTLERTKGLSVKINHNVEEILPTKKKVVVRDLVRDKVTELSYDRLIVASGSVVRSIGISGSDAKNVFRVKSISDGITIKKYLEENKPSRCVIIGGGYVGMEMCEALVRANINVTVLHLDEYPMTGLEDETRKAVLSELTRNKVNFKPKEIVSRFATDQIGNVVSVTTEKASYDTDFVILSVGVEANVELASKAGIRLGRNKGIVTDERQLTNIDFIYAAGDCCEVRNVVSGKWMYLPLATYASRQGRVAGENAAGGRAVFKGAIRAIAVKIFDMEVAQVGLSSFEADEAGFDVTKVHTIADSKVGYFPGNEKTNIVALADRKTQRLLGANVFGGQGSVLRANVIGSAIQQRLTVEEISRLDLIYSPPFSPLWDPVIVMANHLKKRLSIPKSRPSI